MKSSKIRLLSIRNGLSIQNAVEKLGISKSMLYKIETGGRSPSKGLILKMSTEYNCSIDELFKAAGYFLLDSTNNFKN